MEKILLVEDDRSIIVNLTQFLESESFEVASVTGQKEASMLIENNTYDIALVDISLDDGNGFAVCQLAKEHKLPVIFLTASGDEYSVVMGLDMGAEDYINKPFRPRELVSRIKNVLRRNGKATPVIEYSGIKIDTVKGSASKNGHDLFLSALEYKLLLVFFNNRGTVLGRNKILEEIWDITGDFVNDNTLTVYIKRLRDKIEDDPQNPEIIKTIRGLGYKMGE